jgi:hypothetical protein
VTPTSSPAPGTVGIYTTNGKLSSTSVQHSITVDSVGANGSVTQVTSKGGITPKVQTTPGPGPGTGWSDPNSKLQYYEKKKREEEEHK